jgi:cation/acetate symporter
MKHFILALCLSLVTTQAHAGTSAAQSSPVAIGLFLAIVAVTLSITAWAAKRSRSLTEFYAAGGTITGWQNGLAIAGDALSAGAFLGLTALVFSSGFDGLIFAVGYTVSFPVVVFLIAERLRSLGRYTFSDVLCHRLDSRSIRALAGAASLTIVSFYLIAQMVGAGQLIQLLFGLKYIYAEVIVGTLMISYVLFGGMLATTWVQIVKAVLLLLCGTAIAGMVLVHFDFSYDRLLTTAINARPGIDILKPTMLARNPAAGLSLALTLMFGTAGLPHVLMRFFTVPDVRAARNSVVWAVCTISYFYALIFVLGFGAVAIIFGDPAFLDANGQLTGGANMAAVHLAGALGGNIMLGIVAAVAFATILAVVAGLTLAGASAVSHDLYAQAFKAGGVDGAREVWTSKLAALGIGFVAVLLGIMFEKQNVAYMISLAFGIAASSTFPLLVFAIFWNGLTTRGAVLGGACGLFTALGLTIVGPSIWVKTLGFSVPLFPFEPPTIVSMPLAITVCFVVSWLDGWKMTSANSKGRPLTAKNAL